MKETYSPKVCCVGLGPAGIGGAYILAQSSLALKTLSLDAGGSIESRGCPILHNNSCLGENPCQLISGVGGCSAVCGGKMAGYPAGKNLASTLGSEDLAKDKLATSLKILRKFLAFKEHGTPTGLTSIDTNYRKLGFKYRFYPVYTFNRKQLAQAYRALVLEIESKGVSVLRNTRVVDIGVGEGSFVLTALQKNRKIKISTEFLLFAVGRFGQDLLKSFAEKVNMPSKQWHLDIGVRLEFPTELCPNIDDFHKDLKLLFDSARTFCLCKDGKVAPYRFKGIFILEGSCNNIHKTGFTNLAITIRLKPSAKNELIFNEIKERVLRISGGLPIRQMLPEYLGVRRRSKHFASSINFWKKGNVNQCFQKGVSEKLRVAVRHFVSSFLPQDQWWKVGVFAPEVDIRPIFQVKSDFSLVPRIYLAGDCTGRFRGILQAFCSGTVCGENIIGDNNR